MPNKEALKKEAAETAGENLIDKEQKEDIGADKIVKKPKKRSSVLQIDEVERSAVGAVKVDSSRDVRGSNGLANTGTIISYD